MTLREQWRDLDTAVKVIVGLGIGAFLLLALVAVLVVFAAIVGSFVLGVGSTADVPVAPQVEFEVEYGIVDGGPAATVTHDGGDAIDADAVEVRVGDGRAGWPDDDGDVTAGDEVTVPVSPGTTLRVVWLGDDEPAVLFDDETPPEGSY